jgi:hypothetical protein
VTVTVTPNPLFMHSAPSHGLDLASL